MVIICFAVLFGFCMVLFSSCVVLFSFCVVLFTFRGGPLCFLDIVLFSYCVVLFFVLLSCLFLGGPVYFSAVLLSTWSCLLFCTWSCLVFAWSCLVFALSRVFLGEVMFTFSVVIIITIIIIIIVVAIVCRHQRHHRPRHSHHHHQRRHRHHLHRRHHDHHRHRHHRLAAVSIWGGSHQEEETSASGEAEGSAASGWRRVESTRRCSPLREGVGNGGQHQRSAAHRRAAGVQRGRREEISPEPLPLARDGLSSSSKTEEVELAWSCLFCWVVLFIVFVVLFIFLGGRVHFLCCHV